MECYGFCIYAVSANADGWFARGMDIACLEVASF